MKFKILKGTKLFDRLTAVRKEMTRCNKEALKVMKEAGAKSIRGRRMVAAGGISSFIFEDNIKPDNWSFAYGKDYPKDFMPTRNRTVNKDLLGKIANLPVVEYDAINDLLNYDFNDSDTNRLYFIPGLLFKKQCILLVFGEQYTRYKPVKDMIEITHSEYLKLGK